MRLTTMRVPLFKYKLYKGNRCTREMYVYLIRRLKIREVYAN